MKYCPFSLIYKCPVFRGEVNKSQLAKYNANIATGQNYDEMATHDKYLVKPEIGQ